MFQREVGPLDPVEKGGTRHIDSAGVDDPADQPGKFIVTPEIRVDREMVWKSIQLLPQLRSLERMHVVGVMQHDSSGNPGDQRSQVGNFSLGRQPVGVAEPVEKIRGVPLPERLEPRGEGVFHISGGPVAQRGIRFQPQNRCRTGFPFSDPAEIFVAPAQIPAGFAVSVDMVDGGIVAFIQIPDQVEGETAAARRRDQHPVPGVVAVVIVAPGTAVGLRSDEIRLGHGQRILPQGKRHPGKQRNHGDRLLRTVGHLELEFRRAVRKIDQHLYSGPVGVIFRPETAALRIKAVFFQPGVPGL